VKLLEQPVAAQGFQVLDPDDPRHIRFERQ
jgi:hypothetical protein